MSAPSATPSYCQGIVQATTAGGARTSLKRGSTEVVHLTVGEMMTISADGPCGSELYAAPQRPGVLQVVGNGSVKFKAVTTGTVSTWLEYPGCDDFGGYGKGADYCHGGIAGYGYLNIVVGS